MTDHKWDQELVNELTKLANPDSPNRAVLAHLRRGIDHSPDYTLGRCGWLFRRVPDFALTEAILAAGLFAWVKGECRQTQGVNFGAAFGAGLTLAEKQQREKRFIDLLDTDGDELPYKLRQAITLLARDGVGLDWILLIRHLVHWSDSRRWVQKKWSRGFWAASEAEPDAIIQQPAST